MKVTFNSAAAAAETKLKKTKCMKVTNHMTGVATQQEKKPQAGESALPGLWTVLTPQAGESALPGLSTGKMREPLAGKFVLPGLRMELRMDQTRVKPATTAGKREIFDNAAAVKAKPARTIMKDYHAATASLRI